MASQSSLPHASGQGISQLLSKLTDPDPDFRYMALNDLHQVLITASPGYLHQDYQLSTRIIDGLLKTLADSNGEVQNMTIKCLGPFVNKVPESVVCPLIEKIAAMEHGSTVDSSIPALALRAVIVALPRPVPGASRNKAVLDVYHAVRRSLIPRVIGPTAPSREGEENFPSAKGMLQKEIDRGTDSNVIDVLIEIVRFFGPSLQIAEVQAMQKVLLEVFETERAGSVLKKKAVSAFSTLAVLFSDDLLSGFISRMIENFRNPHLTPSMRKLYITLLGSLARSIPRKFGPYLKTLAPFVLSAVSENELEDQLQDSMEDRVAEGETDEVLEAALTALDSFLSVCGQDMLIYTEECISAATRLVSYDPNIAPNEDNDALEDDDDEDGAFPDDDEDFEEAGGFDDEDDMSWKVRRSAAKLFYTIILTRSNGDLLEDGTLYDRVAPALLRGLKEREESVRVEILAALSLLVRRTGENAGVARATAGESGQGAANQAPSRKRRRGGSDASMLDSQTNVSLSAGFTDPIPTPASTEPLARLTQLSPDLVRGLSHLLKSGPLQSKQASMVLLKDIIAAQGGGLSDHLDQIVDGTVDAISGPAHQVSSAVAASSSATPNSVRVHALQLLAAILQSHTSKISRPFLAKIIPVLVKAADDKFSKVATASIIAIEQVITVLTPPLSTVTGQQAQMQIEQLFSAIIARMAANDADLEIRQQSIRALGVLLGRTSGTEDLLSMRDRTKGLKWLADRLRNELTRLPSIHAIDVVAALAKRKTEFEADWVRGICLELGAQLRKANRPLRVSSLHALKTMTANPAVRAHLDESTIKQLVDTLLPVLTANDLHMLSLSLTILTVFVKDNASVVVTPELNTAICTVVKETVAGSALDALLRLLERMGEIGAGAPLMTALLKDVGVSGNPDLLGKAVGTLLASGGSSVGVKADDFVNELNTVKDSKRKCLALAVLGEAALRFGHKSPVQPQLFISYLQSKSEIIPLTAAVSLGRAGAGNINTYLPVILSTMQQSPTLQYLLLHSVKELLQHSEAQTDIIPYAEALWQTIVEASKTEDNKAIGAECIGRLAIIDPKAYLPQLQTFLSDTKPSVRGMVISALRYVFADSDEQYNENLRPIVMDMLAAMLNESDIENRRLALTTLSSAAHSKPGLIMPHLGQLLPLAMKETVIKPELVREVQMGPFKHKVDDGLEVRKSAYETLYALLETLYPLFPIPPFYDRIIAGITDEHDIRTICTLILTKLLHLAPEESHSRLDSLADVFRQVLIVKPKESAVKTEIERIHEGQAAVIKVSVAIQKMLGGGEDMEAGLGSIGGGRLLGGDDPKIATWRAFWEWMSKEFSPLVKAAVDEAKGRDR